MRRQSLSRPVRLALLHGILDSGSTFFDYGCGRGDDIDGLVEQGIEARGWDPAHRPNAPMHRSDVVNLGFVVNVIDHDGERRQVVQKAWSLARRVLVISARLNDERDEAHVLSVRDGWVTRRGTFQKFFDHEELGVWIESVLGSKPVAASPGVYYVFRDAGHRESYLASRFRRRISLQTSRAADKKYADHRELLEPLIEFAAARGRLPAEGEVAGIHEIVRVFGSLRQALRVLLVVTDASAWERVQRERAVDVLVHLALARFHGRPRWSDLPDDVQRDVRAFYRSYRDACTRADRLLFATASREAISLGARGSLVGKVTPAAVYVHVSALHALPALLRVYEGCGRALAGTVEGATLVKLFRGEPRVSYLRYPTFDEEPHPELEESIVCDLADCRVRTYKFSGRDNPPILHRKELFVSDEYPRRSTFERLTGQEERAGLLSQSSIGTREEWARVCRDAGVELRGHRLVRSRK
jgi:DNA phosphorothioation-associated putative methyltransferase